VWPTAACETIDEILQHYSAVSTVHANKCAQQAQTGQYNRDHHLQGIPLTQRGLTFWFNFFAGPGTRKCSIRPAHECRSAVDEHVALSTNDSNYVRVSDRVRCRHGSTDRGWQSTTAAITLQLTSHSSRSSWAVCRGSPPTDVSWRITQASKVARACHLAGGVLPTDLTRLAKVYLCADRTIAFVTDIASTVIAARPRRRASGARRTARNVMVVLSARVYGLAADARASVALIARANIVVACGVFIAGLGDSA